MTAAISMEFIVERSTVEAVLGKIVMATGAMELSAFQRTIVHPFLSMRAEDRFASEGDKASGGAWEQLSEASQHWRKWGGFDPQHPINKRTGKLEDFVTKGMPEVAEGATSAILSFPGATADFIMERKMTVAQAGDSRTPARPVLGIDSTDVEFILIALSKFVAERVRLT